MQENEHICTLIGNDSLLSLAREQNLGHLQELWLRLRIVSDKSAKYSYCYRSKAAVKVEKRRQYTLPETSILHPFSSIRFYWETIMVVVYLISFMIIPFEACNIFFSYINPKNFIPSLGPIVIILHLFTIMDIVFNFRTGYVDRKVKKIILEPNKIAINYLKTYFIVDVLSTMPAIMNAIPMYFITGEPVYDKLLVLNLLKLFRIKTCAQYSDRLFMRFQLYNLWYQILKFILKSVIFFHFCGCVVFIVPFIYTNFTLYSFDTWIHLIVSKIEDLSVGELYMHSLLNAIYLTLTCSSTVRARFLSDFFMTLVFAWIGLMYFCWLYVELLDLIRSRLEPETKFDEFITQLRDYSRHNQLPSNIQQRMYMFFEYRYQRTYFREDAIMSTLSDQICKEIKDHCCKELLRKVKIFDDVTDEAKEEMLENLVGNVYLPKDVIVKAGSISRYIYFISYGTLAVYTVSGKEVCHLWDGNYFGEEPLLLKDHKMLTNIIAIEISEVYHVDRNIFLRTLSTDSSAYKRLVNKAKDRVREIKAIEAQYRKTFDKAHDIDT